MAKCVVIGVDKDGVPRMKKIEHPDADRVVTVSMLGGEIEPPFVVIRPDDDAAKMLGYEVHNWLTTREVDVWVVCLDKDDRAAVYHAPVTVNDVERAGKCHYDLARDMAHDHGLQDPMVCFDDREPAYQFFFGDR